MNYTTDVVIEAQPLTADIVARAQFVQEELVKSMNNMEVGFFDMCDLLAEAKEGNYHLVWNYGNFDTWVEQGSGLKISARQAAYAVNVARQAKFLGIKRDELVAAGSSKIKQIMSLNPELHQHEMIKLIESADKIPYGDMADKVKSLKDGGNMNDAPNKYITLKLDPDVKEIFDEAVELARKIYGDTITNGHVHDISISKALELICIAYTQDINNYPEPITEEDFDAEG